MWLPEVTTNYQSPTKPNLDNSLGPLDLQDTET